MLKVPNYETNKIGTTANWNNAETRSFSNVYVASATDSAATINSKLAAGLDILIQPGNLHLSESLKVNKAGQVILGIGMTTLISTNGNALIEVGDVDSVRIAGLTLEAGTKKSPTLLKWGSGSFKGSSTHPGVMSDVFARVGGPTNSKTTQVSTEMMVQINTNDIIVDHTWLWRADHDIGGLVYNSANYVATGLQVNSDNVKAYGLFVEHTLGDMTAWNGNHGEVYFYQSELPYDVTQANYADKGFASYKLGPNVTSHKAHGLGVYTYFRDNDVMMNSGIVTPNTSGTNIHFENSLGVFLNGKGGMKNILNNQGTGVHEGQQLEYLCNNTMFGENATESIFLQ
jgi:hypothetical protein